MDLHCCVIFSGNAVIYNGYTFLRVPGSRNLEIPKITTVGGPLKCFGTARLSLLQLFPLFVAVTSING